MLAKDSQCAKTTEDHLDRGEHQISNARHRLGDNHAFQRRKFQRQCHRLRDCHRDHLITLFEGSSRNFCDRGLDVDLEEALCMDGLSRCGFNFVSEVTAAESDATVISK